MTKKIGETLKKTDIEDKKTSFKITKKNKNKNVKKVILETPILEKASREKIKKTINQESLEQTATGLLNVAPNSKRTLKCSLANSPVSENNTENIINSKVSSKQKKEISINQNSSFFYEPSIFEKFNIEVSKVNEENASGKVFDNNETLPKDLENSTKKQAFIMDSISEEYDFISTETPDIYKTNFSFENDIVSEISENNEATETASEINPLDAPNVFKTFSYEEKDNSNVETSSPINNIVPQPDITSTVKTISESFNNNENIINNMEVSASQNIISLPTIDENILNNKDVSTANSIPNVYPNIITQPNTSLNNEIDDLSDDDIDKELDEVLGISEEKDDDDFSIEEYFGVTSSIKEDDEDIEENIEKEPEMQSFSKLIENFAETISTLSNKISNLESNITEQQENNKKMDAEAYIENLLNTPITTDDIDLEDINLEDITLDDISLDTDDQDKENIQDEVILSDTEPLDDTKSLDDVEDSDNTESVEDLIEQAFDNSNINEQMKQDLISEVLSNDEDKIETESDNTSDFLKVIESLSKTISELESAQDMPKESHIDEDTIEEIPEETISENISEESIVEDITEEMPEENLEEESLLPNVELLTPSEENTSEKAINILIRKDDMFSIEISNETYEIVADFDGISVLSENIHLSTPKNNFYVSIGEKYIEIHKQPDLFVVNTNFEDIEFANAINNVTFAKKKNKIELNIKEAFKITSINKKVELSMLNSSIANLAGGQDQTDSDDNSSICDSRTLIINEETQKVYLPYTIEEVMKKLNDSSDYQSIQDVIDQEYTLPLSTFRMPIISRFREAYKFMRVKEKSSIYAALDLAFELMFNSNLNPAIIRAAKDLKELNIYLDCLYENELEKFDCFKIIYKVLPKIQ